MKTLMTERLIMRAWRSDDTADLYELMSNARIGGMAGFKPRTSLLETRIILEVMIAQDIGWAICRKADNKVIGSIELHRDNRRASGIACLAMGYFLNESCWDQGYISEACREVMRFGFEELCLELMSIYHYTDNPRSQRVIEKMGFNYEGTLRRSAKIYDGSVKDEKCYSLTSEEYRVKNKP